VNINTQRGKQSGYCTLNPLDSALTSLSNGNLNSGTAGAASWKLARSTVSVSSGKWYWEGTYQGGTPDGSNGYHFGLSQLGNSLTDPYTSGKWTFQYSSVYNQSGSGISISPAAVIGDTHAYALDLDAGTLSLYVNGILKYTFTSVSGSVSPFVASYGSSISVNVNFGQKPFKFPPPAGFQPLALANTPRPTIVRPDQFVGIVTYYAADGVAGIVTGLSFKPDLVWVKSRTSARSNVIVDSVRGTSSVLWTNLTDAQLSSSQYVSQFNSNGFNYGVAGDVTNNSSLVGWCWKAGGNSNTYNINDVGYATASAAGLTAGTITPTGASVNTKSGFSIITYTGTGANATIAHGGLTNLSNGMIIVKNRSSATNWRVYHSAIGNTKAIFLSTTGGTDTSSVYWNNTSPTSTVFSVGSDDGINGSGNSMVAYCWAEIPGFSKFGNYTGNASTDGPFVFTGFRPRWLLVKETGNSNNWFLLDSTRNQYNYVGNTLWPNLSNQENDTSINPDTTYNNFDFLSNGFKPRSTYSGTNRSGGTFIYAAFAETPTQNLYGAQSNAR
jgi:hypothetical protein